ncbi:MAG: SURF1 family cytochrome oxidase biogenesis protein [Acidimicrobiia bacterium]
MLAPRWLVAHVVVVALAILFINLGFWQLRRLEERRLENTVGESRFEAEPDDLALLLDASGEEQDTLEFRRATATGEFQPDDEVLVRSQVHQGVAGFHVITPLLGEDGNAVLVNRGWVPLDVDQVPATAAPPPDGTVTVTGWVRPTQTRGALGPSDPDEGRLVTMSRVDVNRIQQQVPYQLYPVYLSLLDDLDGDLPIVAQSPSFDDEGSHLAYAIQWFSFALIGLVGYFLLMRRTARRSH